MTARLLVHPDLVQEITDGCRYDVSDLYGAPIGEAVPAWVARVIAAVETGVLMVRVHSTAPMPGARRP